MTKIKNNNYLNLYSWCLLFVFFCATFAMNYQTSSISLISFFEVLPLIALIIYQSEKKSYLISHREDSIKKSEIFARNQFILSYGFLIGCLFSLLFYYNNIDVKGWWPLIVYFITFYGLFFSTIFSLVSLLINRTKIYTIIFTLIIISLVSLGKFIPKYLPIPNIGNIETFYVLTVSLLVVHCFYAIFFKMMKYFQ